MFVCKTKIKSEILEVGLSRIFPLWRVLIMHLNLRGKLVFGCFPPNISIKDLEALAVNIYINKIKIHRITQS